MYYIDPNGEIKQIGGKTHKKSHHYLSLRNFFVFTLSL